MRTVHVATFFICNRRGELPVKTGQLLSDGKLHRQGMWPVSEKMRPQGRAVQEELDDRVHVRILGGRRGAARVPIVPGTPSRYVLHAGDAELVEGVTEEGDFDKEVAVGRRRRRRRRWRRKP